MIQFDESDWKHLTLTRGASLQPHLALGVWLGVAVSSVNAQAFLPLSRDGDLVAALPPRLG